MKQLLLVLLLAATLGAQTVDDREESYGPFDAGPRDPSFALAVAPHGMLLAWSEIDPETQQAAIHTGLLNHDAQLIGPIRRIPPARPTIHATTPAVVTDGNSFFVAWLERDRYSFAPKTVAGVLLDRDGVPAAPIAGLGQAEVGSPSIVWTGLDFRVYSSATYSVALDGSARLFDRGRAAQRVPFATPEANGWITWTGVPRRICWGYCPGPSLPSSNHAIDWVIVTAQWTRTGRNVDGKYVAGAPVVIAKGDDLLIVWRNELGLKALRVEDGVAAGTFELLTNVSNVPAIAESLVVFERDGDIYGSVIAGNTFGEAFPISTSADHDELPRVYLVGPNRYLVTYVRREGSQFRLAGRFVTTP